jgi:hypothetical protein
MMPTNNKFDPTELVEPSICSLLSVDACFELVGLHRLKMLNLLREDYEIAVRSIYPDCKPVECAIVINGMWKGVKYIYSGVRSVNCIVGVNGSQHKECVAYDLKARHMDILLMLIRVNYKKYSISRIESPDVTMQNGYLHTEFTGYGIDNYWLIEFLP